MKYVIYILFLSIIFSSCDSPIDVQASREKLDMRQDGSKIFEVIPNSLALGDVLLGSELPLSFTIRNLSNSKLTISKVFLKNQSNYFTISSIRDISLSPYGTEGSEKSISFSWQADKLGILADTLFFGNYFAPFMPISANVPEIFSSGVDFGYVKLGERKYKTINIYNFSSDTIYMQNVMVAGDSSCFKLENFKATESSPIAIAPNFVAKQLIISFSPLEQTSYSADFSFAIKLPDSSIISKTSRVIGSGIN